MLLAARAAAAIGAWQPLPAARNVIVLVPDGCSQSMVTLARWFGGAPLAVDRIQAGAVMTHSANNLVTDSAAAATAMACGRPFVIVRKGVKDYATGKLVEGPSVSGKRVLLVEDVGTTAGAALEAAKALVAAGATITRIVFAVDRLQGARENVTKAGFVFDALLTKLDMGI